MDYIFRYRLNSAPQARLDGSAQVAHDIEAVWQEVGDGDTWTPVPGHHKTVLVPGAELLAALESGTTPEKVSAYKGLLVEHHADGALPLNTNWNLALLEQFMDQNDVSVAAAAAGDAFILQVAGGYPVTFSL
jgi:hypothetical protein